MPIPKPTPPARKQSREAGGPERPGQGEQRAPDLPVPEDPEDQSCQWGRQPASVEDLFSGGFQSPAIPHARRAGGLATAAAETPLDVLQQSGIVRAHLPSLQRAHQHDASSRAVALVSGDQIGRTGGKAEATMHAGVERCVAGRPAVPP